MNVFWLAELEGCDDLELVAGDFMMTAEAAAIQAEEYFVEEHHEETKGRKLHVYGPFIKADPAFTYLCTGECPYG